MIAFIIIVILLVLLIDSIRLNLGFIKFFDDLGKLLDSIDKIEKEEIEKEDLLDLFHELKLGVDDILGKFKK